MKTITTINGESTANFVKRSRLYRLNLTQAELAERLDIERRSIIRYERGAPLPIVTMLAITQLAEAKETREAKKAAKKKGASMLTVNWIDFKQEPRSAPDRFYPDGMDVNIAGKAKRTCFTELPYPAARCGVYIIDCDTCGLRTGVTTAGRPDDPRSVTVACRAVKQ